MYYKTTNQFYCKRHICHGAKMLLSVFLIFYLSNAKAQISGTKTVCASGCDYSSIGGAVSDLKTKGINGKTTIAISTGQYNESVSITGISGLSATNTLTFKGMGSAPTDVHVYNTDPFVIKIKSASYITLQNLFIEQQTKNNFYYGISLDTASNCIVRNCKVIVPVLTTSMDFISPIVSTNGIANVIEKNIVQGGYKAIDEGNSTKGSAKNKYLNNDIKYFYYTGIHAYYSIQNLYEANIIDSASNSSASAILSSNEINAVFKNNFLKLNNMAYGAYLVPAGTLEFSNNMILGTATAQYGVYVNPKSDYYFSLYPVLFTHNTIHGCAIQARISNEWAASIDFLNNNLTGNGITLYYSGRFGHDKSTLHLKFEGNNYHRTGSGDLIFFDVAYTSLAAYKTALSKYNIGQTDQNVAVKYKSATDLHIDQSSKMPYGKNIGISTDFDGDTRCRYFVTSGADESTYSGNAHYTKPAAPKFTYPSTVYAGNPTIFSNSGKASDPILYKWYVDGKFVSDSFQLETYDLKSPSSKVKLVAYNCGGKDSTEVTVTVSVPASAPVAGFISNTSFVKQNDVVKFEDVSSNYPNGWQWEVSPDTVLMNGVFLPSYEVVYSSLTKANPHIKFNIPGKYKICLTASNAVGSSTDCITDYIEVVSSVNMQESSTVSAPRGFIYDDGGPNGNYNQLGGWFAPPSYKLLIDACADSIYIVFTKFDLACGIDNLNVYQGKDNKSTNLFSKCSTQQTFVGYGSTGGPSSTSCVYSSGSGCYPTVLDTLKAKGTMFIELGLDGRFSYPGFEAYYWTTPSKEKAPVAKFFAPDSLCTNQKFVFADASSGKNIKYLWDFDGDLSAFESTKKDPEWVYYIDGTETITLITENCGGTDTFRKNVVVHYPGAPKVSFSADNTNPTTTDVVFFSPEIKECIDYYRWTFTPASGKGKALYMNGAKNTSGYPQVTFTDTGCYTTTLYVGNVSGEDSLTMTCFVHVKEPYCIPTVNTLITDIGISKVIFNTIKNESASGTTAYNNYLPELQNSTKLEQGLTYNLTVERKTNKNKATRAVWIDWNHDGDFDDSLEFVAKEISTFNLSWSTNIKMPVTAKFGASVMRIGIFLGSQTPSPCGPSQAGEFEDYRIYLSPYTTLPEITLIGDDTVALQRGYKYLEPGAKAVSSRFGDISSSIVIKQPIAGFNQIQGNYYFYYDVTDSLGNKAKTVKRLVNIVADTTAPELIVEGPDTIFAQVYDAFQIPAILKAIDVADSNRVDTTINSNINISKLGDYTLEYIVTDKSGNKAVVYRYVRIVDTILPELILIGNDTIYQEADVPYSDAGVQVSDNYTSEPDLRSNMLTESDVNVNVIGDYYVTYTVTDPNTGKKVSVTRTVFVRDTRKPDIKLLGDSPLTLDVMTTLNDPGVAVTDNFDAKPVIKVDGSFYNNFPNGKATKLGTYEVLYMATDASGNTVSATRTVLVKDREAPIVTLRDAPIQYVCRWKNYTDAGFDATDNYDDSRDLTVKITGSFLDDSTKLEGIYTLRYEVTDRSGNIGYSAYRYINVQNPYASPCGTKTSMGEDMALEKLVKIYPNPNTGKFTLESNIAAPIKINVTDVLGKEVAVTYLPSLGTNAMQVDISACKPGVYLVNISTQTQTVTKRIVISR